MATVRSIRVNDGADIACRQEDTVNKSCKGISNDGNDKPCPSRINVVPKSNARLQYKSHKLRSLRQRPKAPAQRTERIGPVDNKKEHAEASTIDKRDFPVDDQRLVHNPLINVTQFLLRAKCLRWVQEEMRING